MNARTASKIAAFERGGRVSQLEFRSREDRTLAGGEGGKTSLRGSETGLAGLEAWLPGLEAWVTRPGEVGGDGDWITLGLDTGTANSLFESVEP